MVKNPSPKQAKAGHSNKKQTPQSGKIEKATPMSVKSSGKQPFRSAKSAQTPVPKSAQKFGTPKQALNFQTPKSTPQIQSSKKGQASGKKVSTPHPMKKKEIESDDESEDEEVPKNGSGSQKKQHLAKQLTPMKKQGKGKMQSLEDLDDSDDISSGSMDDEEDWDSIDEDEEEEATPPSKKMIMAQLKAQKGLKRPAPAEESDEEESDEEDEEEEDDDEEDESEDDDEVPVKPKKNGQQAKAEPAQKKMKNNEGKVAPAQIKRPAMLTTLDKKLQEEVNERKRDRNSRSVFFKNLHRSVTDDDIKALSSDILFVQRKKPGIPWGWIMFANEQTCKKNYQKLNGAKVGNSKLELDLCDKMEKGEAHRVDALKLYVGNLPRSTKDPELKRLFPKSSSIFHRPDKTFAIIGFESPELARQAFQSNKDAQINGAIVTVCYAKALGEKGQKPDPVKKFAKDKASGKIAIKG